MTETQNHPWDGSYKKNRRRSDVYAQALALADELQAGRKSRRLAVIARAAKKRAVSKGKA